MDTGVIRCREKFRESSRNLGQGTRKSKMGTFVAPYQSNVHQTIVF